MAVSPGGRPADASPLAKPGNEGPRQLVDYIREVAHALIRKGHPKSEAIHLAYGIVQNWASGKGNVSPKIRAAAAAALADQARLNGQRKVDLATPDDLAPDDAMVALMVPPDALSGVAGADMEDPHITLAYLGSISPEQAQAVAQALRGAARQGGPLYGQLAGLGQFPDGGNGVPYYAPADVPGLDQLRTRVTAAIDQGVPGVNVRHEHGFTPHVTLKYGGSAPAPVKPVKVGFTHLSVVHGARRADIPLGRGDMDMSSVEYGTNAQNPLVDVRTLDLSAVATGDTIDLAPGDYRKPYHWKHGYIPISPEAVASKKKRGPSVGKGHTKPPKGVNIAGIGKVKPGSGGASKRGTFVHGPKSATSSNPISAREKIANAETMYGTGSKQHKAAATRFGAQARAEDDVARGRGVPGAVKAATPKRKKAAKAMPADVGTRDGNTLAMLARGATDEQRQAMAEGLRKSDLSRNEQARANHPVGSHIRDTGGSGAIGEVTGYTDHGDLRVKWSPSGKAGIISLGNSEKHAGPAKPAATTGGLSPKSTADIAAGDVIHEPKVIGGGTRRLRVDKVHSANAANGNRNADVTDLDTGATHAVALDGTKTHQVAAGAPHANKPGSIADRINQKTQADMRARRAAATAAQVQAAQDNVRRRQNEASTKAALKVAADAKQSQAAREKGFADAAAAAPPSGLAKPVWNLLDPEQRAYVKRRMGEGAPAARAVDEARGQAPRSTGTPARKAGDAAGKATTDARTAARGISMTTVRKMTDDQLQVALTRLTAGGASSIALNTVRAEIARRKAAK